MFNVETFSPDDDRVTETVVQREDVRSHVEPQQTSPSSSEQTSTRQVSGKALATPAVRKMAMENNVSQLLIVLNVSCSVSGKLQDTLVGSVAGNFKAHISEISSGH